MNYIDTENIAGVKSGPRENRKLNRRIEAVLPLMTEFFEWTEDPEAREEYVRKLSHRVTNDPSPEGHLIRVVVKDCLWKLSR